MAYHLVYQQFTGVNPRPQGSRHTSFAPYGVFPTADGTIMIGISNDRLFRRLCAALGKKEWARTRAFNPTRNVSRIATSWTAIINAVLRAQTTCHWRGVFDKFDVPNDAVQNAEQVMNDPQIAALQQLAKVALAGEAAGRGAALAHRAWR